MKEQDEVIQIFNGVTREQLEKIYDILGQVFPVGRAFFQERLDFDSTYNPDTTWAATVNGQIASSVQIFPFQIRVGQSSLKIGGIGSVSTSPSFQGKGLAHQILKEQIKWMEQQQYDLSLLFAVITPFYEKIGWGVVPETLYELKNDLPFPDHLIGYEIVPFEKEHLPHLKRIYEQFNDNRTYSAIREESFWQDQQQWARWKNMDCLVVKKGEEIVAYGQISQTSKKKAPLDELLYLKGHEDVVVPLFLSLAQLRLDADYIAAKLPEDHALIPYLLKQGAHILDCTFSMWKIIRFYPMLQKLHAELQHRLHVNPKFATSSFHLHLICEEHHAYLSYQNQQLRIEPEANCSAQYSNIEVSQKDMISMILNGITEHEFDVLCALFPPQYSTFYNADKF